jgi:hypothetical protein
MGWGDVRCCFAMAILGEVWSELKKNCTLITMATAAILNPPFFVSMATAAKFVAVKGEFFQNGCHCHGNGQNAKKLKNTKRIIAGYSPNRN